MSSKPIFDLEVIKDRASLFIDTTTIPEVYTSVVQFQADHWALIDEVERLRRLTDETPTPGPLNVQWDKLYTELSDAKLTLAMIRGEGWPPDWKWCAEYEQWVSPCKDYIISECKDWKRGGCWWVLTALCPSQVGDVPFANQRHRDPLSALKAYYAHVYPSKDT